MDAIEKRFNIVPYIPLQMIFTNIIWNLIYYTILIISRLFQFN